ncbi:MAG: PhnD/SsuA/transferrin family substrate-binding protein [Bryobacteraceae bacterium]
MTRGRRRAVWVWSIFLAAGAGFAGSGAAPDSTGVTIRMAASSSLVGAEVNENDARAAIRTWADTLSRETGLHLTYLREVLVPPQELFEYVRQGQVDAFSATIAEYLQVAGYTDPGIVLVDQAYVNGGEEYLLLVHEDSGIRSVGELRGHSLAQYNGSVMSLAPEWLATLLAESNLGAPASFFNQITLNGKISRTVLLVFFRQYDACLVTRRTFDTMKEMNPQLGKKLRVLATSPKLVPIVVALRKNSSALAKEKFSSAMTRLGDGPAGRQLLSLFGSRRVMVASASILGPSIELVTAGNRLKARGAPAKR